MFAILCFLQLDYRTLSEHQHTRPTIPSSTYIYRDSVLSIINSALTKSQYHQTERKYPANVLRMY